MRFTLEQQRPNKTRFEVSALGQKNVRVFDGAQGWTLRAAPQAGQGIDGNLVTLTGRTPSR